MPKTITTEVIVQSNPKHKGIVDLKTVGEKDKTGAVQTKNGIRWVL